jgi:hypothetical protein
MRTVAGGFSGPLAAAGADAAGAGAALLAAGALGAAAAGALAAAAGALVRAGAGAGAVAGAAGAQPARSSPVARTRAIRVQSVMLTSSGARVTRDE